jgi:Leucine-rich repeat (LRR) protein
LRIRISVFLILIILMGGCTSSSQPETLFEASPSMDNVPAIILNAVSPMLKKPVDALQKEDFLKVEKLFLSEGTIEEDQKQASFDLSVIATMKNLKHLSIDHIPVKDFSFITQLQKLETLGLSGFQKEQLPLFEHLKSLISLTLEDGDLSDLNPLESITNIQFLNLRKNQLTDISSVSSLKSLTSIEPLRGLDSLEILLVNPQSIQDIHLLPEKVKVSHTPILDES